MRRPRAVSQSIGPSVPFSVPRFLSPSRQTSAAGMEPFSRATWRRARARNPQLSQTRRQSASEKFVRGCATRRRRGEKRSGVPFGGGVGGGSFQESSSLPPGNARYGTNTARRGARVLCDVLFRIRRNRVRLKSSLARDSLKGTLGSRVDLLDAWAGSSSKRAIFGSTLCSKCSFFHSALVDQYQCCFVCIGSPNQCFPYAL